MPFNLHIAVAKIVDSSTSLVAGLSTKGSDSRHAILQLDVQRVSSVSKE